MRRACPFLLSSLGLMALVVVAPAHAQPAPRPKFQIAVGMGASFDGPPNPEPGDPVPSYFFSAGLGAGLLGVELRSFANAGDKQEVVRVSGELVGLVRPLVPAARDRPGYGYRVLRSFSFTAGPALEKVGIGVDARWRRGGVLGAHVDVPIGPAGATKELRVRLGVRRMVATRAVVTEIAIGDSDVELYGQLAFVF